MKKTIDLNRLLNCFGNYVISKGIHLQNSNGVAVLADEFLAKYNVEIDEIGYIKVNEEKK